MRANLVVLVLVAAVAAGCAAGDPAISKDHRYTGHFGPSPTADEVAGR